MLNIEFGIEFLELGVVELVIVVSDDHAWELKYVDNGFPHKAFYSGFGDLGEWFGFDPFGEVLHGNNQELSLARGQWEGSEDVDSPLRKEPRGHQGSQFVRRLSLDVGKSLALSHFRTNSMASWHMVGQ